VAAREPWGFHRKNMGKKWRFHPEIGELAGKHWDF
jgi:hypothetical protein